MKYKGEIKISDLDENGNFKPIICATCKHAFVGIALTRHLRICGKKYQKGGY